MVTISSRLITELKQRRVKLSNIKRDFSRQMNSAQNLHDKSISSMISLQKKLDATEMSLHGLTQILNQDKAKKKSIEDLIKLANSRLNIEKKIMRDIEQNAKQSSNLNEMQVVAKRLISSSDKISTLVSEIKSYDRRLSKLSPIITQHQQSILKLTASVHQHLKQQPIIQRLISSSSKDFERRKQQFLNLTKQDDSMKDKLELIAQRILFNKEHHIKSPNSTTKKTKSKKSTKTKTKRKSKRRTSGKKTKAAPKRKRPSRKSSSKTKAAPKRKRPSRRKGTGKPRRSSGGKKTKAAPKRKRPSRKSGRRKSKRSR